MEPYYPFQEQDSHTQFDNYVLDVMMPSLPPTAWKILTLIIRKTRGWIDRSTGERKRLDKISYKQIMEGTGIKSSATVCKGVKVLLARQYIVSYGSDEWEATAYGLNLGYSVQPASKNEPALFSKVDTASKSEVGSTSKNEDTKERVKKERKTDTTLRANDARAEPPQAMLFDDSLASIVQAPPVTPPEKKPRQPDAYLDTIMLLWQVPAQRAATIKQQLQGRVPTSKPHHHTNLSPPVELEEAIEFATRYYPRACKGCSLPKSPEKLQDHIEAMRREKGQQAADIKAGGTNIPGIGYQPIVGPEFDYYE